MTTHAKTLFPTALLLAFLTLLGGCGSCGFDCNNDNGNSSGLTRLTLGISDSLPETLRQVVIQVDSITFRRSDGTEVVVDNFTIPDQKLVNAPTFQVNLLDYPGVEQLLVIENLEIDPGDYTQVDIRILDGGINESFVQEEDDALREIIVTSGVLTVPGIQLDAGSRTFTVEFGLAQALQQQPSGRYLLTSTGVRLQNNATSATLSGEVDSSLFNTVTPCSEKANPQVGNRVYLYQGINLVAGTLADVFTTGSTNTVPSSAIAPFAVATLLQDDTDNWRYAFGFLPAGDYTLAFACDTATDDSVNYNGLQIPLPAAQLYEVTLTQGQQAECNLAPLASC